MELLADWQSVLAKRWTNILFSSKKRKKEPWFNNALRKFIINFLDIYDRKSDEDKDKFHKMILSLIDD
ncbi:MAG: hypothetical protein LUF89_09105 [Ruminococcus sp.]|nr:hypothetical protein [Ruminococcus sp.]